MKDKSKPRSYGARAALLLAAAVFLLAGCFPDPARRGYERAEGLLGEGRYEQALAEYSDVAARSGSSAYGAKSLLRSGMIYGVYLNDGDRAFKTYSEVISLYPGTSEASEARGEIAGIYSRRGEHSRAVEEYQKLIEERPGEGERVRFLVAMEYVKMNDLRQARVELTELLKGALAGEFSLQVKYQIANTYYLEGDTGEALKRFEDIVSEYPGTPIAAEALFAKAKVFDEEGRLAEALEILRGLEGKYPNEEALKTAAEWTKKRLEAGLGRKPVDRKER